MGKLVIQAQGKGLEEGRGGEGRNEKSPFQNEAFGGHLFIYFPSVLIPPAPLHLSRVHTEAYWMLICRKPPIATRAVNSLYDCFSRVDGVLSFFQPRPGVRFKAAFSYWVELKAKGCGAKKGKCAAYKSPTRP